MKYLFIAAIAILTCCSASQFTYYEAYEGESPWRISVEKNPWESFSCIINDSTVIEESFPLLGISYDNMEKDGIYRGKHIKMSGFRTTYHNRDENGNTNTVNTYQIRIFVELEEVAKFDF